MIVLFKLFNRIARSITEGNGTRRYVTAGASTMTEINKRAFLCWLDCRSHEHHRGGRERGSQSFHDEALQKTEGNYPFKQVRHY